MGIFKKGSVFKKSGSEGLFTPAEKEKTAPKHGTSTLPEGDFPTSEDERRGHDVDRNDRFLYMGERVYLDSTAVQWAEYEYETQTLHIAFSSGQPYPYHGVPPRVALDLLHAPSAGTYVATVLKSYRSPA